ncbi:MAG: glycosyltransferase [Anaerolineae bacterium]|nr:glycosyltransferase [Anaerolineae bacterium]
MNPPQITLIRRIAMLSVHTCPLAVLGGKKTGGMNVYVRELAREFGRRGIYVDIFTRSHREGVSHIDTSLGDHVRVIHIPAGPDTTLDPDEVFNYLPEFVANVLQFARRCDVTYDVIYSHYWLSGWVAHALRAEWNIPVAQMFHTLGLMKDRIANKPAMQPVDQRSFAEADIMTWADRLIAATPAEREQMLWLYRAPRRKIEIVSPGVDLQRFSPLPQEDAKRVLGIPKTDRMLLFVGRIERLKGIDTIFESLTLIKRDSPALLQHLHLCIIGGDLASEDAEMARLKRRCYELGLSDLVLFLGAKDQDTLNYYYAAAEALIMPSDYESFGMVALEAMASGTPVIASEVGGLAFLVQDDRNGYHVPVRDPQALADKITVILSDPAKRAMLASGALATAKHYSWSKIADQLLAVFQTMQTPQLRPQPQSQSVATT